MLNLRSDPFQSLLHLPRKVFSHPCLPLVRMGILPPVLFIDDLMKVLNKPYYVSLFSASALHGAAHQQPFEFYVTTVYPANRRINSNGVIINFYIKTRITETG